MKNLFLVCGFFLISQLCIAQTINIDSCGLDSEPYLNQCEIKYFNQSPIWFRKGFDFKDKKIAFTYENSGRSIISKKDYFERWGRKYYAEGESVYNQLYILTPEEKEASGGYDAIIVSWSKLGLTKKHKKAIVEKLKNQE